MKRVFVGFMQTISSMKLRNKLLLSYFLLILIPFGIFFLVSDHMVSRRIETLVKFSARQSFDQSVAFISNKLDKVTDTMNTILGNTRVSNMLSQNPDALDIYSQIKDMNELMNYLQSFKNKTEVYNAIIYLNSKFLYANEKINFLSLEDGKNTDWYKKLLSSNEKRVWLAEFTVTDAPSARTSRNVISALKPMLDPNDYTRIIGILRIDMLEANLNAILEKTTSTQNSATLIQNSRGEIISSYPSGIRSEYSIDSATLDEYTRLGIYSNVIRMNGEQVLLTCQKLPQTDWTLISITPYSAIITESKLVLNEMLLWFWGIGTAAYAIAYLISISITRRISRLITQMRSMKKGSFGMVVSHSSDEIGELIQSFNEMSRKMEELIEEQFRTGQAAKSAEMLALQSQINPHFLYNTLDLINWTAINNNVPEIAQTVQALSRFYKLSLSKGADLIPISDEIQHVRMYVEIQNQRFSNAIALETDIAPEVYGYKIIKITLQPIVENAIIHGILQKEEKCGIIRISGRQEDGCIHLEVRDDGIGISQEKLAVILSAQSNREHGYGIRNINERIKLLFGSQYGLAYESAPGHGTRVTILFPANY